MNRTALLAAALLLAVSSPAHAWLAQGHATVATPTTQVLLGHTNVTTQNNATRNYALNFSLNSTTANATYFPIAGTITKMKFTVLTPPTSGTWAATIMKNGVATALTCTVSSSSSPAGECNITASASFTAGQFGDIRIVPAGLPTASIISVSSVFQPDTVGDTFLSGIDQNYSTTLIFAGYPFAAASASGITSNRYALLPDSGTIDRLYVTTNAPGIAASGKQYDFTVGKSGVVTALTCPVFEVALGCTDLLHSVAVAAPTNAGGLTGDDLQFQGAPTNGPTASSATIAVRYRPTTVGSFPLVSNGQAGTDSTTVDVFYPVMGGKSSASTIEANAQIPTHAMTITQMTVRTTSIQGNSASARARSFTLRKNGVDTAITCTMLETASNCVDLAHTVTVADDDKLDTVDHPIAGTGAVAPLAGGPGISFLAHQ